MFAQLKERYGQAGFQFALVAFFLVMNTILNIYNKWIFMSREKNGAGLTAPLFVTLTHSAAGFVTAHTFARFPNQYVPKEITGGINGWSKVLAISLFFSAGIGFNNSSLMHIPLSLAQMIKSSHPALLAFFLFLFEGTRYSWRKIGAIAMIMLGICLTVVGSVDAPLIGIIFSFCSVFAGALNIAFISMNMGPKSKLTGMDVLYYTTFPIILIMITPMLLTGEHHVIAQFVETEGLGALLLYVLIGCGIAVSYNLTQLFFIKELSAIYLSITGTSKVAVVVFLSVILFGDHISAINVLGILITLSAFAFDSYLTYQEKSKKQS